MKRVLLIPNKGVTLVISATLDFHYTMKVSHAKYVLLFRLLSVLEYEGLKTSVRVGVRTPRWKGYVI